MNNYLVINGGDDTIERGNSKERLMKMNAIDAVILCGGLSRRMQGEDKGLQLLHQKPLFEWVYARLKGQVRSVSINANRHLERYAQSGLPVIKDELDGFLGPLSGMLTGLMHAQSECVLFVPCDAPFLPDDLCARLYAHIQQSAVDIAYVSDGEREHPTFVLMRRSLIPYLQDYLFGGGRKVRDFMQRQRYTVVDFSDQASRFANINYPEQLRALDRTLPAQEATLPMLGISGYSGSGKTTLLEKLLPALTKRKLRVSVIKHTHHHIQTDKPGKDSARMTEAGAKQVAVTCDQRWAIMTETPAPISLTQLGRQFDRTLADLILVEGFKHEPIDKIMVYRQGLDKAPPEQDAHVVAIASDVRWQAKQSAVWLDLNDIEKIADFVLDWWRKATQG
ncbi:molybdenum cofactor guanylyltransferase MobA [Pasteurellaceae bacterium HPA106]|uniref:molybdenum cofactor guanylyltransferase MobA n=1 Tax=Spirabiliibacterium pneumoniae TaxID=221400 RepID=UPI001AADE172|nr:molybdenum cofactor guanylyltransferase MobA [Spirabiliibacterium pneumoniae]MBE2896367.1 molybdenum cofactor guanylyltransferase MobA [Spirabiliibacterium pneumoniae]